MQLFSADAIVFSKKLKKNFFDPEKVKKWASKVAHNRPRPFYFTVQPRPQPTAQNWFFILWNLGTRHLFSYLCCCLVKYIHYSATMNLTRLRDRRLKIDPQSKTILVKVAWICQNCCDDTNNFCISVIPPNLNIPSRAVERVLKIRGGGLVVLWWA